MFANTAAKKLVTYLAEQQGGSIFHEISAEDDEEENFNVYGCGIL